MDLHKKPEQTCPVSRTAPESLTGQEANWHLLESPDLLWGIIRSAMDAIICVDAQQRIRVFNAAAEKMFLCSSAHAIGQSLDKFIPARYREAHRGHVEDFGKTGVTARAMGHLQPLSALRSNGEEFPIEASISQAEAAGERIYTVILRDVTGRKQAEEQIRHLNAELELRVQERTEALSAANRELESFTYSVAHDLRAPLRHMDAFSKILIEDFAPSLPAEAVQYLQTIQKSSNNMARLVTDLLNLARIGRHELVREPTSLDDLLSAVLREMKGEVAGRQIEWKLLPLPSVECDPGLLKQVLVNLVSNAVKYTRPRPLAVIEIGCAAKNGQNAIFVKDNGVGFDMKYIDKLFGVFHRLHRQEEFEGTGVGLAMVDRIVRKHGGSVWAEATLDQGATFYFTLPELKNAGCA